MEPTSRRVPASDGLSLHVLEWSREGTPLVFVHGFGNDAHIWDDAAPGVAASMALVALGIANELTGTLLLSPNGTRTLATKFWALTGELDYVAAAPYAVLLIVLSLPLTVLLRRQADKALAS